MSDLSREILHTLHERLEAAYVLAATKNASDDDRALASYLEAVFRALHDSMLLMTATLLVGISDRPIRSLGQMLSTALLLRDGSSSVLQVAGRVKGKHTR